MRFWSQIVYTDLFEVSLSVMKPCKTSSADFGRLLPLETLDMQSRETVFSFPTFRAAAQRFATSALAIDFSLDSISLSSTSSIISLIPGCPSVNIPGRIIVYDKPLFIRSSSAFRFHSKISPSPDPSGFFPTLFRKWSGSFDPMELTKTTFFIPSFLANSICAFCPMKSTFSGHWPCLNLNRSNRKSTAFFPRARLIGIFRRAGIKDRLEIMGTAEVQIIILSIPSIPSGGFSTSRPSTTSQTNTSSSPHFSQFLMRLRADLSDRTSAIDSI
mmetsp:Transcript_28564/g.42219  ORF Transcript_28564/g.42219 Transcript_28564/m.42219 type:complete len:272 (+) Transcript_28564:170-985(+)